MLKDQGIRATGTVRTDFLGKELKLNKKSIKTEVRGAIKCHYEKNGIGVICWNDNGPVTVISNLHVDIALTTVKHWDSSSRHHIKIDHPHCITKYNKYMGRVDSHYINTVDTLKSAAFKDFKLVNPDARMDFLPFTCWVAMHYLKAAKVRRKLPPNIMYPRKRSWKGNASVPEIEKKEEKPLC